MSNKMALDALTEIREALRVANETPNGPITDTIWMPGRPETLFDAFDAAIAALQAEPQPTLPEGWGFSSADFSLQASGVSEFGGVMLARTGADRADWHFLDDEQKEDVPLYVSGTGQTVAEAVANAAKDCTPLPATPPKD